MIKKFIAFIPVFILYLLVGINIWADNDDLLKDRFDTPLTNIIKEKKLLSNSVSYQIPFIRNEGQIKDSDIKFYTKTINGVVYINNKREFIYNIFAEKKYLGADDVLTSDGAFPLTGFSLREIPVLTSQVELGEIIGLDLSPTTANYFIGNSSAEWRSNINTYNLLDCGEIWNGIFLNLKANSKNIEKLFIIMPEGNVESIQIKVDGVKELSLTESGEIELITPYKNIGFTKPVAFQEINGVKKYTEASYRLINSTTYGFSAGDYDKNLPLIIDPLLVSTYIGGNLADIGRALAVDSSNGNIFIAGYTTSIYYPTALNSYDRYWDGGYDIVVSKFNSDLTQLLASTYLGGTQTDAAFAIALDSLGNVFITGQAGNGFSTRTDRPNTNPFDSSYNGGSFDVIVAKLNNNLSELLASTYLGGTGSTEAAWGIAVDNSNNVFLTGYTDSQGFPTSSNVYDNSYNFGIDVFVTKFNNNLSGSIPGGGFYFASTFIGSALSTTAPGTDLGYGIAIDNYAAENYVFITGIYAIGSPAYPTTSYAYDQSLGGAYDAFVSKFSNNLQTLLASTYLGGLGYETGWAIAMGRPLEEGSTVYVTGTTSSADFPVTLNAYNFGNNAGLGTSDVFVSRFNNTLSRLLSSTWIGGTETETPYAIMQNNANSDIYICGTTDSGDYPVTEGVFGITNTGGSDAFITRFNDNLSILLSSSFIGGTAQDIAYGIKPDGSGNIVVAGQTSSSDYPVWPIAPPWPTSSVSLAYDSTYNGGSSDIFVTKITFDLTGGYTQPPEPPTTGGSDIGGSSGTPGVYLDDDSFRKTIGSCFIASTVYNNPMNPDVIALRNFRDSVLLSNSLGQNMVENYYKISPRIANYLVKQGGSYASIRIALKLIIYTIKYPLVAFIGISIVMLFVIIGYCRRVQINGAPDALFSARAGRWISDT